MKTIGMAAAAEVVDLMVEALERQGIGVEQYYAELGHGQHELSVSPRTAVEAADVQVLVRETIRGVATGHGLVASLAPKPWPDEAGNGAHAHISLWDASLRCNLFHDDAGRYGLSELAEQFVAGILAHLPGLLGLTAPTFNSFQRLLPEHWSSAYVCWGPDNREAAVRVPSTFWGREMATANLEYKPIDASCNPYLAFGGLIAAGLDGIDRGLAPPDPVTVDPHFGAAGQRRSTPPVVRGARRPPYCALPRDRRPGSRCPRAGRGPDQRPGSHAPSLLSGRPPLRVGGGPGDRGPQRAGPSFPQVLRARAA